MAAGNEYEISVSVYSTAMCSAEARATVERYLYDHTTIVESFETLDGRGLILILKTTASADIGPGPTAPDVIGHVRYLAQYQCDRLQSGLFGATPVGTLHQARERALALA